MFYPVWLCLSLRKSFLNELFDLYFVFRIQLRYGTVWGPAHNGGGSPKADVSFESGETITAIDMDKRTHWGAEVRTNNKQQQLGVHGM